MVGSRPDSYPGDTMAHETTHALEIAELTHLPLSEVTPHLQNSRLRFVEHIQKYPINTPVRFMGKDNDDPDTFRIGRVAHWNAGDYTIRFYDGSELIAQACQLVQAFDSTFTWKQAQKKPRRRYDE